MDRVKNTRCGLDTIPVVLAMMLLYFPLALWGAEGTPAAEGKTLIVYPTSRFVTLNHACFRKTECEQEVMSFLKKTPGITNVMSHSRQGAIMADFDREKVKPEEIAQKVAKVMEEKGFGNVDLKITGSRIIPNKLTVRLLPTRVTASSERFA